MELTLCSIKDNAIDAFQAVFTVRAAGEAMRSFADAINDTNKGLYAHADDYDLYTVGTYDDVTGTITPHAPNRIARGKDLKQA